MHVIPIGKSAPISNVTRAPPTASPSLVSPNRRRAEQSSALFRSIEGRRSPESCPAFSIGRGTSHRVYHRRPWLSEISKVGGAPNRFLARPVSYCASVSSDRSVERHAVTPRSKAS